MFSLQTTTSGLKTSGGAFTVLSNGIFKSEGVVFSAKWNDEFYSYIAIVADLDEIDKFRHSNYIRCEIRNSFLRLE